MYVFKADVASSVLRRALAQLLEPEASADTNMNLIVNVNTNSMAPAQTVITESSNAQDDSVLTNRARPPIGANGSVATAHVACAEDAFSNAVPGANVNGVCERSTSAPLYLSRHLPDSLAGPQAAHAMNGVLLKFVNSIYFTSAYTYLLLLHHL